MGCDTASPVGRLLDPGSSTATSGQGRQHRQPCGPPWVAGPPPARRACPRPPAAAPPSAALVGWYDGRGEAHGVERGACGAGSRTARSASLDPTPDRSSCKRRPWRRTAPAGRRTSSAAWPGPRAPVRGCPVDAAGEAGLWPSGVWRISAITLVICCSSSVRAVGQLGLGHGHAALVGRLHDELVADPCRGTSPRTRWWRWMVARRSGPCPAPVDRRQPRGARSRRGTACEFR